MKKIQLLIALALCFALNLQASSASGTFASAVTTIDNTTPTLTATNLIASSY
jgi:hypothetical protein